MMYFDYSWVLAQRVGTHFCTCLLLYVLLWQFKPIEAMHDCAIKDTYTIFRNKQARSPLHGFIWKDIVKIFYQYGNKSHATIQLIRELFYLNEWDHVSFGCTILPNKPATYFSPHTIGVIVRALHEYYDSKETLIQVITELIKNDVQSSELQDALRKKYEEELLEFNEQASDRQRQLTTLKVAQEAQTMAVQKLDESVKKNHQKLHHLRVKHNQKQRSDLLEIGQQIIQLQNETDLLQRQKKEEQQKLKPATQAYKEFEHAISKRKNQIQKLLFDQESIKKLATLIVASYDESTAQQLYLPHTTMWILLAFLWKKSICKADLMAYIHAAVNPEDLVDPNLFDITSVAYQQWCQNFYPEQAYHQLREKIIAINKHTPLNAAQMLEEYYEELVVLLHSYTLMTGVFPPLVDPGWTEYGEHRFADCACTALRNLLQTLIYDPATGSLRESIFEQEGLDDFFKRCKYLESLHDYQLRKRWAALISNLNDETQKTDRIDYKMPPENGVCEIASRSGLQNILMVLKKLLGVTITVDDSCMIKNNIGNIVFTINGKTVIFHAQSNHYYCTHQQAYTLTDIHIDGLIKQLIATMSHHWILDENASLIWNLLSLYRDNAPELYAKYLHDEDLSEAALSTCALRMFPSRHSILNYLQCIVHNKRLYQQDYWFCVFEAIQRTLIREDKRYIAPVLTVLQEAPFIDDHSLDTTKKYRQLRAENIGLFNQQKI